MMICDADANNRVFPSGAAWATRAAPIAPLAPATFSTTTGWPSAAVSRSLTMRAMVSVFPPAAYGTTAVMGRVGQSLACAVQAKKRERADGAQMPAGSRAQYRSQPI